MQNNLKNKTMPMQPREVDASYYAQAEELTDFIDYLFDIEQIGDYKILRERFRIWEEHQENKNV